jgi:hypothetical protein
MLTCHDVLWDESDVNTYSTYCPHRLVANSAFKVLRFVKLDAVAT